jgi:hypothetical protein
MSSRVGRYLRELDDFQARLKAAPNQGARDRLLRREKIKATRSLLKRSRQRIRNLKRELAYYENIITYCKEVLK